MRARDDSERRASTAMRLLVRTSIVETFRYEIQIEWRGDMRQ